MDKLDAKLRPGAARPQLFSRRRFLSDAIDLLATHRKPFVLLNVAAAATVLGSMAFVAAYCPQEKGLWRDYFDKEMETSMGGWGQIVTRAFEEGHVLAAIALTFPVNLFAVLFPATLPSFIVPYLGIGFIFYRFTLWGIIFSPFDEKVLDALPHWGTILLEGEAYVVAAVAIYLQSDAFVRPARYGHLTRHAAFKAGVRMTSTLYRLVVAILAIAAVHEAFEVIYLPAPKRKPAV